MLNSSLPAQTFSPFNNASSLFPHLFFSFLFPRKTITNISPPRSHLYLCKRLYSLQTPLSLLKPSLPSIMPPLSFLISSSLSSFPEKPSQTSHPLDPICIFASVFILSRPLSPYSNLHSLQ
eukprot:TRINITY_DN477_c2_g3_i8.p1 TRINITY_DN477_c2_g3~~TRINITY_DN477_c2_g3_i8.p1  ORF type:complete len:121 (-),score=29.66 TRINITY_DN477_c2_g3_i8:12-374(-)